jgi:hypothetical protein
MERHSFLKHLNPFGNKDAPKADKADKPIKTETKPLVNLAELKDKAGHILIRQYEALAKEAKEAKKTNTDQGLKLLQAAEAVLLQAETLINNPKPLIDDLEAIIATEPAQAETGASITEFSAQTPEGKEVKINLAERLKYWQDLYQDNNIDWIKLPDTISITPEQQAEMTRLIAEHGFDQLIIIPENLSTTPDHYEQLHTLMSEGYATTFTGSDYDNDGKFGGSKDKRTALRLILTKDVQNLADDALFKSTKGLSVDQLDTDFLPKHPGLTGLAESEYLILQRDYFKRTEKHLDASGYTWLPESTRPSSGRVPYGYWDDSELVFGSDARDVQDDYLGCRLAGSFEI